MTPLRRSAWTGEGGTRGLLACVLQDRLDEVLVDAGDADAVRSLLRSGLPLEPDPANAGTLLGRPLLSASELRPVEYDFVASSAEVAAYGAQSGDLNPLHFDDARARRMGFEGRIVHGMLFNGWLTRYLGMCWPGPGTLFRRSQALFLAPVYPDRPYTTRLSVPIADHPEGHYRVVAQLLDSCGRHCTIAHADVVHRDAPAVLPPVHAD